ncbi:autotransporter-associated beta strand repeat-containing protein [Verrucomicrobium sp. BvORR106]|uniref:autotransporter-associated beta strand repeat-containing protein n=1 Tax=Verrucomicrobium sp. BvORR106 TaxID=1403819 RepID=UPI00056DEE80|nr:autotransporter-associated beta strand repeat-containing protein [Verrucomicrobium sp. BvORR106]
MSLLPRPLVLAALPILSFLPIGSTPAADVYKADNNTQISQAASWSGGVLPTSADTFVISDIYTQTGNFGTGAPLTYFGLRVEGTLTSLITINNTAVANFVALGAGGIDLSTGHRSLTIGGLKADVDQTWNLGSNTLTLGSARLQGAGNVTVIGTGELNLLASNIMTKGLNVTGVRVNASTATSLGATAAVIQKINPTGQAYLTATGTYANSFNLSGTGWGQETTKLGALRLANGAAVAGSITLSGDALITAYQSTGTLAGAIGETGGAYVLQLGIADDTGVITLSGTVNLTGGTVARGGTIRLGANNVFGDTNAFTVNGAILDLNGFTDTLGTLTLTAGSIVNTGAASTLAATDIIAQSGSIAASLGGGKLTKTTSGTVTITGVQSYTGGTQIDEGILLLDGADLLSPTGSVQVNGGALDISGHNNHVGAVVLAGGSIVNTGSTAALTATSYEVQSGVVSAVLAGSGVNLVKNTNGTVWLTAANTYSGLTTVNAGTLQVTTQHAGGGGFTVNTGARLAVGLTTAGDSLVASSLTLDGGTLVIDLGTLPNPATGAPVLEVGAFTIGALSQIDLSGSALSLGQFSLLSYSTITGNFTDLVLGSLPARTLAELINNTSAKTIDLKITGVDVPRWTGLAGNNWDVNTTTNWSLVTAGSTTTYLQGPAGTDSVLFDDLATNTTVNLTTELTPISTTVNNSTKTYTFAGSGALAGTGGLTKNGTGTLIFAGTGNYTFSGGISLNNGTLQLGDGATTGITQPGTGAIAIAASGRLEFFLAPGQNLTISNVIQGSGTIVQKGSNVITLAGGNSGFSGSILVSSGTLKAGYDSAFGTAAIEVGVNGTLDTTGYDVENHLLVRGGKLAVTSGLENYLGGTITLDNGGAINTALNSQLTVDDIISGTGGFTKGEAGTLILASANTYTGVTTLDQGLVRLGHATGLGAVGSGNQTVVKAAATLDLAGQTVGESLDLQGGKLTNSTGTATVTGGITLTAASVVDAALNTNLLLQGVIDGAGSLTKTGTGKLVLSGTNTYAGGTLLNGGTLVFSNASSLPTTGVVTVSAGTVLGFSLAIDQALLDTRVATTTNAFVLALGTNTSSNLNLSAYSAVSLGALSDLTFSGSLTVSSTSYLFGGGGGVLTVASNLTGTRGITIGNGGTVVLSGNNTHVGTNSISSGLLKLNSATALGAATNILALQYTAGSTTTVDLNGYDVTVGGFTAPQNPAALVQVTDNSSTPGITTLTVNIASGSNTFGSWIRDGANGRQIALVKTGAGTLVFSSATNTVGGHTFSGGLYLNQGTLDVRINQAQGLPSATDLYFTGTSNLLANNNGGAAVAATIVANSVHFQGGLGTITLSKSNNSTNSLFTLNGTLTREIGAAGNFAFSGVTATDVYRYSFSDFFLPADVLFDSGIYFNGNSFATIDYNTGFLRGLDYVGDSLLGDTTPDTNTANALLTVDVATLGEVLVDTTATGKDLQIIGTGHITAQTSETLNTLRIAGNNNITLAAGATLEVQSILKAGGNASEISGGTGLGLASGDDRDFLVRTDLATDTLTLSSVLLGSIENGLTKSGLGTLILAASNQYAGITNILDGTLKLAHVNGLGLNSFADRTRVHSTALLDIAELSISEIIELYNGGAVGTSTGTLGTVTGEIILNGSGSLQPAASTILRVSGIITGSGSLAHTGAGQTILTSANTFTGDVNVNNGTLVVTGNQNLGLGNKTINVANAARPAVVLDGTSGNLTLGANYSWNLSSDGSTATLGALINLAGTNTINGVIHLTNGGGGQAKIYAQAGKLIINGNIDSNTATSGRTLSLDGPAEGELNGVISDTSQVVGITKSGTGIWTVNGNNTYTGAVSVTDGTLRVSNIAAIGTAQALGTGAAAITLGSATTTGTLDYTGLVDATLARNFTVSGVGGGIIKNSSGHLLTLSGILTHNARPLTFSQGAFLITGNITGTNANSHTIISNAQVTLTNTTNNYNGNTVVQGGGTLKNGASEVLPNGTTVALGDATANSNGTYDLNGYNETITGLSRAGTGQAVVTNSAASGTSTLTVTGTSTYAGTIVDGASAQVALIKSTAGILTLSGVNTYTGSTQVTGGTLAIAVNGSLSSQVSVSSGATLDLLGTINGHGVDSSGNLVIGSGGATGLATIHGALTTTATSGLFFDIKGADRGASTAGYDAINGLTGLTLTGTINVALDAGFTPTDSSSFNLIDWTLINSAFVNNGYTFNFTGVDVSTLGLVWRTDLFSTTGTVYLSAVPEPGRFAMLALALGMLVLRRKRRM